MKFLIVFLLLISSCDKGQNSKWADYAEPLDDETQAMSAEFIMLVNNHRKELGLTELIMELIIGHKYFWNLIRRI